MTYSPHIAIKKENIDRWRKRLRNIASEMSGQYQHNSRVEAIEAIEHQMGIISGMSAPLHPEFLNSYTKGEVMEYLELLNGSVDAALPQQWVNSVHDLTGQNIAPHAVWDCENGAPIALTKVGQAIIDIYNHLVDKS